MRRRPSAGSPGTAGKSTTSMRLGHRRPGQHRHQPAVHPVVPQQQPGRLRHPQRRVARPAAVRPAGADARPAAARRADAERAGRPRPAAPPAAPTRPQPASLGTTVTAAGRHRLGGEPLAGTPAATSSARSSGAAETARRRRPAPRSASGPAARTSWARGGAAGHSTVTSQLTRATVTAVAAAMENRGHRVRRAVARAARRPAAPAPGTTSSSAVSRVGPGTSAHSPARPRSSR